MKTYFTLRSTLSNTSWIQRGTAVLVLTSALMFTLIQALQPTTHAPASTPAVHQVVRPTRNPNIPVIGAGSAYDGQPHGTAIRQVVRPTRNPNIPVIGAGSAYDGQ